MRRVAAEQAVAVPAERPAPRVVARAIDLRGRSFELAVAACTLGVGAFLLFQLTAWPPHEDETLALFIGRKSLGGLLHTVLDQRGGAPLHFLLAWVVAHTGGGFTGLRLLSAIFATASVPLVAILGARLAGRATGLVATLLVSGSWMLLFHGIYGRMYSLFLFTSALSTLALLNAIDRRSRKAWALWVVAILVCVAGHPYGALVLAAQGVYVVATRVKLREAIPPFVVVAVAGIPFWRTDLVLAGRFDVGVGSGSTTLRGASGVSRYLEIVASDFTAGYTEMITFVLVVALVGLLGLVWRRPKSALLVVSMAVVPVAALVLAKLGSAAPMSRHLIFILPFFAFTVAEGLLVVGKLLLRRAAPVFVLAAVASIVSCEVAWGWQKTPELYRGEPHSRVAARNAASAWLAAISRPDDVLFAYEPVYLDAWARDANLSKLVIPRADYKLALKTLQLAKKPLGHAVWVFDASDTTNYYRRSTIKLVYPEPASAFESRAFGPYLVIRTVNPVRTIRTYLKLSRRVEIVGWQLAIGDADVNAVTVLQASNRLAHQQRAKAAASG